MFSKRSVAVIDGSEKRNGSFNFERQSPHVIERRSKTNELVNLAFSARHKGISVWVLTQQMTSIAKAFRENIACLVLFYSPSARDMKIIFENYAGDLSNEEKQRFLKKLKEVKYSHLDFSLRHPFGIEMHD